MTGASAQSHPPSPAAALARDAEDRASYRQIVKSTSIIGGASVIAILIGIVRTKLVAMLLGPAGIGLIGLLSALMAAAGTIVQMGMGSVGTRQIAEAHATGDKARLAIARRALMVATLVLSAVGGSFVWLLRDPLATYVLRNEALAGAVGWVGLGVALSVAALAQSALIRGMRRIKDLALLQIGGALAATFVGLPLVWLYGEAAIPLYVVVVPLTSFLLGHVFVARLPRVAPVTATMPKLRAQWRMFVVLGVPMMGAGVATTLTTLWIQADIKAELGIEALGHYVASNTIAMQYVGIVLGAMAADFYPRLTGVIADHAAARRLVNQQTEVALLLAGPMILAMFALAPLVIRLLYSDAFAPAAEVLRWQAAGTFLKVITWPLGFILLAAGAGRVFFLTEVSTLLVMAAATSLLVDRFGLVGAGMGYVAAYAFYLPLLLALSAPRIGLRWSGEVVRALAALSLGLAGLAWGVFDPSPFTFAVAAVAAGTAAAYLTFQAARVVDLARHVRRFRGA